MIPQTFLQLRCKDIIVAEQVRKVFDQESIDGLRDNLKVNGQLQPVRVRRLPSGKFQLIDGERRLRAHIDAGLEMIDAIVVESPLQPHEVLMQQLAANVHSVALTPIEKAKAFANLIALTGWTATEAATQMGISGPTASRLVAMMTLPEEIQEKVHQGKIPFSAAYELSKIADSNEQTRAAEKIERGEVNRDGLAAARRRTKTQSDTASPKLVRSIAVLEDGRSITVSAPGNTLDAFIEALEECLKRARHARPSGASLPTFLKLLRDKAQIEV